MFVRSNSAGMGAELMKELPWPVCINFWLATPPRAYVTHLEVNLNAPELKMGASLALQAPLICLGAFHICKS
jgi:hypothetical protein